MTNELWFRRKTYGYGWTPASGKGWLVIAAFMIGVGVYPLLSSMGFFEFSESVFIPLTLALVAILLAVCIAKGEKAAWQWGRKDKSQ